MGSIYVVDGTTGMLTVANKIRLTPEGGIAVLLANNSGVQIDKGMVVQVSNANDQSVVAVTVDDVYPIGVAYENIPTGQSGWIVVSGRCEVLVDAATAPSRNWWLGVSATTNGYARSQTGDPGATVLHSREIGHTLQAKHSGNLCWAIIHFN